MIHGRNSVYEVPELYLKDRNTVHIVRKATIGYLEARYAIETVGRLKNSCWHTDYR